MTLKTAIALGIFFAVLVGCASSPTPSEIPPPTKLDPVEIDSPRQKRLLSHYQTWRGVPHRLGGLSHKGIDCSGFVYVTFRDVFKKQLPRSTEHLAKLGKPVSIDALHIGDLVFFKTGFKDRHVGIYTGDGQFIHASKSSGVMQSSLRNPYWLEHYWKAKRVV